MTANQQHMIDVYRSAQRGEIAPPMPGLHDWDAVREIRDHRRATRQGRPGPLRRAAARILAAARGGGSAARPCA
ncbi:hypothetical protein AB0M87_29705 [Streptomyces sp. NPDC051320]|uniref:hypothetical protein n=1 Tax=Streptomyces sp. NPDC051320 TaxID=3154644 RepID=UPI0034323918